MHPLLVLEHLQESFKDYVVSKYPWSPGHSEWEQLAKLCLQPGQVFQDPVIQLDRPRQVVPLLGPSEPAFFSAVTRRALQVGFPDPKLGTLRPFRQPFTHQMQAWGRIAAGQATVVSTGTGSGKSESFMFPVLDRVAKAKQGSGPTSDRRVVRAMVIYPMNALIEDQHIRFCRYASQMGLKVGVYNGTFNKERRLDDRPGFEARMRKGIFGTCSALATSMAMNDITEWIDPEQPSTFPDVLLTNHAMLQHMLLRREEHEILRGAELQALVLDEAHLYSGTLGLEMAALMARLRSHIVALGGRLSDCVPVATSATLLRGGEASDAMRMKGFFESLFSHTFSEGWQITDEYEEPGIPDPALWQGLSLPKAELQRIWNLARTDVEQAAAALASLVPTLPELPAIASQLPAIVLEPHGPGVKPQGAPAGLQPVVTLSEAVQRYTRWRNHVTGSVSTHTDEPEGPRALELKALLTLCAMAQRQSPSTGQTSPLLGLRVHAFVRSEPRLYRALLRGADGTLQLGAIMGEDEALQLMANPAAKSAELHAVLPAAFCKSCGHEGWVVTAEDQGLGNRHVLRPLDRAPAAGETIFVLHPHSVTENLHHARLSRWTYDSLMLEPQEGPTLMASGISAAPGSQSGATKTRSDRKQGSTNPLDAFRSGSTSGEAATGLVLVRIRRPQDKKNDQDGHDGHDTDQDGPAAHEAHRDLTHCPQCLSTHRSEQMRVSRGSVASDLSVHARNLLASAEDDTERRLLVFCDNRQDTSFLSGFLTDRHKRFRLRRAIYQALHGSTFQATAQPSGAIAITEHSTDDHWDFPLARMVLEHLKQALGDTSDHGQVSARTLRMSLPAEVFNFSESERSNNWDERRTRLIDSIQPSSLVERREGQPADAVYTLNDRSEGTFILRLLTEAILRDLTLGAYKEGALGTLGQACLWSRVIDALQDPREQAFAWRVLLMLCNGGHWTGRPPGLRQGGFTKWDQRIAVDELVQKMTSSKTSLGIFLGKNWDDFFSSDQKAEQARDLLHKWDHLGFLCIKDDKVMLESRNLCVHRQVAQYRSAVKRRLATVPKTFRVDHLQATQKDGDFYELMGLTELPAGWRKLYAEPSQGDHFVRAHEHNAMLDSGVATNVMTIFDRKDIASRTINTIVATPTLEVGIDVPDLPCVIHRSVPPDPSNYAQRSGRAGRDKKRALILVHCGRGSHDSAYFEEPSAMVAGEILPPGCPRANTTILRRHVHAVCLQVLAENGMQVNRWDSYLDRSSWFTWLKERVGETPQEWPHTQSLKHPWQKVFTDVKPVIKARLELIISDFERGLWLPEMLGELSAQELGRLLHDVVQESAFSQGLEAAIDSYRKHVQTRIARYNELPDSDREKWLVLADIKSYIGGFHGERSPIFPISWLQTSSFLPNFDFPSEVASFAGLRSGGQGKHRAEVLVRFARGLIPAMREFAPDQSFYAAGSIFRIKRYGLDRSAHHATARGYGICEKGCTKLTPLTDLATACCECGSPLIGQTQHCKSLPPIVRLVSAQGIVKENIGDSRPDRDNTAMVREALVVGGQEGERLTATCSPLAETVVKVFQSRPPIGVQSLADANTLLDLMTVVGGRRNDAKGRVTRTIQPLYASSEEGDDVAVAYHPTSDTPQQSRRQTEPCRFPFLLGHRLAAEGLYFQIAWPHQSDDQTHDSEVRYTTFQATLLKAIRRQLFLGPRSQNLNAFADVRIRCGTERDSREVRGIYLFDTVPGGSGVLALIRQNWRDICTRASSIVRSRICCTAACKRCIAGFDNQSSHERLDKKSLLLPDLTTNVFDHFVELFDPASTHWVRAQQHANVVSRHAEDPQKSHAEQQFRDLMATRMPNLKFIEQVQINSPNGRHITTPDMVLGNEDLTLAVFVDGYERHGQADTFLKDIHKRNYLETQTPHSSLTVSAAGVQEKNWDTQWPVLQKAIEHALSQREERIPQTQRSRLGNQDVDYMIPDGFEQYDWLFQDPPHLLGSSEQFPFTEARPLAYDKLKNMLVVTTNVHRATDRNNTIDKARWHQFWRDMTELKANYRRVFVLLEKTQTKS